MQKFITEHSTKIAGVCLIAMGFLGFFGAENRVFRILGVLLWGVAVLALVMGVAEQRRK